MQAGGREILEDNRGIEVEVSALPVGGRGDGGVDCAGEEVVVFMEKRGNGQRA